jgi:hypothetical protein
LSIQDPYTALKDQWTRLDLSIAVTRRALSLGSQDTITGWYAKSFAETSIDMVIVPKAMQQLALSMGSYVRTDAVGFTRHTVEVGDQAKDAYNIYYDVATVESNYMGATLMHHKCDLVKLPLYADRPSTSGTWPTVNDPRYRTKLFLDTYVTATNLKKDNGSTNAAYITCMGMADYPIQHVFLGSKNVDLVFSIDEPTSEPLVSHDQTPYGYREQVPITVFALDKSGITAVRLVWAAVQELRRIAAENPWGSLRTIKQMKPNPVGLSDVTTSMWSTQVLLTYTRDTT